MKKILSKLSEFFQDECSTLSMTRLSMFLGLGSYLLWASFIVYTEKSIPDIPPQLAILIGGLYAVNKVGPNINLGTKKE